VAEQDRAIAMLPPARGKDKIADYQSRRDLYRQRRPYREKQPSPPPGQRAGRHESRQYGLNKRNRGFYFRPSPQTLYARAAWGHGIKAIAGISP